MTYHLTLRPAAEKDVLVALRWYDAQAPHQSVRLLDEIAATMARISETPKLFRTVHGDVRRAALRVFPYFIWFVIDDQMTTVQVLAVTHHRRDPAAVRSRLRE